MDVSKLLPTDYYPTATLGLVGIFATVLVGLASRSDSGVGRMLRKYEWLLASGCVLGIIGVFLFWAMTAVFNVLVTDPTMSELVRLPGVAIVLMIIAAALYVFVFGRIAHLLGRIVTQEKTSVDDSRDTSQRDIASLIESQKRTTDALNRLIAEMHSQKRQRGKKS